MKKHTFKTVILTFGIAIFMSNSVFAQAGGDKQDRKKPPTFKELIKELDANEDGKLSKSEIKGPLKEHFSKIDTDEDGFITEKEFEKAPKPERKERN